MRFVALSALISSTLLTFSASSSLAAGIWLYESGAPDMGTASAGRAAIARDASTASTNPAGMTLLDRTQVMAGIVALDIQTEFNGSTSFTTWNNSTTDTAGSGSNAGGVLPSGSFNYVQVLTPDLRLGVYAGSYFGLGADYGDTWQGRYYAQKLALITMAINPTLAYRVSDWFSVGGGFTSMYGKLKQDVAINNRDHLNPNAPPTPDGSLKIDADDWGWGYNFGVMLHPAKGTRIGVTYQSEIALNFTDVASTEGVSGPIMSRISARFSNNSLDMSMRVPQAVTVSGYQQITDSLALMANFGWQNWNRFGKLGVDLTTPDTTRNTTVDTEMKDTWHGSLGAHYRVADAWLLMLGFAYDSSPVSDANRSVVLPLDRQIRYAAGVEYAFNKDVTAGFDYTFIDAGQSKIDQNRGPMAGHIVGEYDANYISAFGLNLNWKF
jgi:long-chain fatty acid transport protein